MRERKRDGEGNIVQKLGTAHQVVGALSSRVRLESWTVCHQKEVK